MKGQVWSYGGIFLIIILTSLALTKISAVGNVKRNIATVDGKMISFVNYADLLIKTFNVSIDFISQRSAYDLGKIGGIEGTEIAVWNQTYPSIGILRNHLENKIKENLPKDTIENGRVVNWGEASIEVLDYDTTCGPIENSKCFFVNGTKSFSIYDKSIDSRILVNHKINHNISSSYFNLLYIGRQIVENPIYSSLLGDMTALKNLLQIDFPDLDFQISSSLGSDSSLVGYWAFDEGLGNIVKDFSSYGNDGSLVNGPIWINGKFGKALQFDGTDDYVEIPDNPSLRAENNKITLVMWFKRDKVPTGVQCLINKIGDGPDTVFADYNVTYYISVPSSGSSSGGVITEFNSQFSYFIAYGSYSFTESVDFGLIRDYNWHHLAETYDGNILKSYLDGSLISTKVTTTKKMPLNDQPVRIGGDIILHNYFNGTIDEVKIYSRALSENEIKEEYNSVPQNEIEITIEDRSCLPNDFYCLAPLKPGEGGIIVDGKQIPYDYLKLTFKTSGNFISPSGVDFGVSVSPSDNTIVQGDVAKPTVNVRGISTSPITLSITGCPTGTTCQFSQTNGVPSFSPTLTITNAPLGTHTMTVTGTNGTTMHSATYSLTVSSVACRCSHGTPDETNCGSCAGATTSKQPSWCDAIGNWVSDQCGATRHDCSCPLGKICNPANGICVSSGCGNGILEPPGEQCDDGNNVNGDGCSSTCTIEVCQCSDGTPCGQCAITDTFKPSWCDSNENWVANQCNAPHNCPCPAALPSCNAGTGVCSVAACTCSDGTSCNSCSVNKPNYCDATGNLIPNQCGPPRNCGCPPATPQCNADGSCSPPSICSCNWINQYQCGNGCTVFIFWNAWWKKCVCNQPFCGLCLPEGSPHNTEVCTSNIC